MAFEQPFLIAFIARLSDAKYNLAAFGIAFITSNKFKSWKGSLLVSGLVSQKFIRCRST